MKTAEEMFDNQTITLWDKQRKIYTVQKQAAILIAKEFADQFRSKWISIKDDILPPFEIKTMIILENGEYHLGYYNGADTKGDCWFCDNNDYHYPTHWKLLDPKPTE